MELRSQTSGVIPMFVTLSYLDIVVVVPGKTGLVILVRVSVGQKHNDERSSLPLYSQNYVGRVPWQINKKT